MVEKAECSYSTSEGETHTLALKRKYGVLQKESDELKELYEALRTRPHDQAYAIFARIRSTLDPAAVLQSVKQADLLLPDSLSDTYCNSRLHELDAQALEQSLLKVSARPWTVIAGDGLVSELLSDFFADEAGNLVPMIDHDTFLEDMR